MMLITVLLVIPLVAATDNAAQLVQTNVNVQNNVDSVISDKPYEPESATAQIAVQQEVIAVDASIPPPPPPSNSQQPPADAQNVQLLKEANAQYQYQINSRYEEKTRPIYGDAQQYQYPYFAMPGYPYYKENSQYQELGNGQRRAETVVNDNVRAQLENQDAYSRQRSQSYSEYGKGEVSPDYNTYSYKRTYY